LYRFLFVSSIYSRRKDNAADVSGLVFGFNGANNSVKVGVFVFCID